MSINLALADAAVNCSKEGATAVITLRSGVQLVGKLERQNTADLGTRHMRTDSGGWITFATDEVVAVEARR